MPLPSGTLNFDEWEGAGFPKDTGCQVCKSLAPLEKAHLISRTELRSSEAREYKSDKLWEGDNFAYLCRPCHEAFDKGLGVMRGGVTMSQIERLQKYAGPFMKLLNRRIELKGGTTP